MAKIYRRPKLYPKQTEAFFNDARYSLIEGSTKSGKTVSCMAWLVRERRVESSGGSLLYLGLRRLPSAVSSGG